MNVKKVFERTFSRICIDIYGGSAKLMDRAI